MEATRPPIATLVIVAPLEFNETDDQDLLSVNVPAVTFPMIPPRPTRVIVPWLMLLCPEVQTCVTFVVPDDSPAKIPEITLVVVMALDMLVQARVSPKFRTVAPFNVEKKPNVPDAAGRIFIRSTVLPRPSKVPAKATLIGAVAMVVLYAIG